MLIPVDIPPGVVRTGTEYTSRGRYYDTNLWRWVGGSGQPVGGWTRHSLSAVTGRPRAILPWSDNLGAAWAAIGTHTHLFAMSRSGALFDITPSGFITGRPDAVNGAGYGASLYGEGVYGTPRTSQNQVLAASVWSLDTWGEHLVGCMADDGRICEWALNTGVRAQLITGAPVAKAVLVTADRILMALGAGSDPRCIQWSDREDNATWASTASNYAGAFNLQTPGKIVTGRQIDGGNLIWTDVDVWLGTFEGQPLVYGFKKRGSGCGAVSQNCVAVTDAGVFWMGRKSFWAYRGYSEPLPSDVQDYVFSDLNTTQLSKIYALHNSAFGEVTWRYCSANASEIDRYVTFNYREGHWSVGQLRRLSGADRGVFGFPLECGIDGFVYDHETGFDHDGVQPFARTGPFEIGDGETVMQVQRIVPDVMSVLPGAVKVSFVTRDYPGSAPVDKGAFDLGAKTDVRFTARSVEMTFQGVDGKDFRVGRFRLEGKPMGGR